MANYNKVVAIGRLGADPELRDAGGTPVCTFRIACSEKYKDRQGSQQERTEWITCVAWSRLAEICRDYLRKGSEVLVEGKLQTRSWDAQDGSKRYATEVKLDTMQMLGGRPDKTDKPSAFDAPPPVDTDLPF